MLSCTVVLYASSTNGTNLVQSCCRGVTSFLIASSIVLIALSAIPFVSGCSPLARAKVVPIRFMISSHKIDVNCDPLSLQIVLGTPLSTIQVFSRAFTADFAVACFRGTNFNLLENLSIMTNRYLLPFDSGNSPTKSMAISSFSFSGSCAMANLPYFPRFGGVFRWHSSHFT